MLHRSAQELREERRRRELFFAHITAQAEAARRETARRHVMFGGVAIVVLVAVAILLPH